MARPTSDAPRTALSPGLKYRHYAPNADVIIVEGKTPAVTGKVKELAKLHMSKGSKVGVLATDETVSYYEADVVRSLGSRDDLAIIAKKLFKLLREFEDEDVDVIIAEGITYRGLGLAVMNRLHKAAGYNIVKLNNH